jgi:hypothetical protein
MLIDWAKFGPALLLLLIPIALFHGKRVRYRAVQREWDGYWGRTASLGLHAIDFGRAALGAWLLVEALKIAPGSVGTTRYGPTLIQAAVLGLATTLQTMVCKERYAAHAPFTFVAGLVVGFLPPLIAGLALLLAVVLAYGARTPAPFFPILSVSIAAFGVFLTGKRNLLTLVITACAVALPWLLCLLFPRPLVVSYLPRRTTTPHTPKR